MVEHDVTIPTAHGQLDLAVSIHNYCTVLYLISQRCYSLLYHNITNLEFSAIYWDGRYVRHTALDDRTTCTLLLWFRYFWYLAQLWLLALYDLRQNVTTLISTLETIIQNAARKMWFFSAVYHHHYNLYYITRRY